MDDCFFRDYTYFPLRTRIRWWLVNLLGNHKIYKSPFLVTFFTFKFKPLFNVWYSSRCRGSKCVLKYIHHTPLHVFLQEHLNFLNNRFTLLDLYIRLYLCSFDLSSLFFCLNYIDNIIDDNIYRKHMVFYFLYFL